MKGWVPGWNRGQVAPATRAMLALKDAGLTLSQIAARVGRSKGAVSSAMCRYGRATPSVALRAAPRPARPRKYTPPDVVARRCPTCEGIEYADRPHHHP
jgi:transposase